uniref:Sulfotransfer_1 domain-containing protein n=1 Tax=Macrostomum lignano TaxID=282301 RepID=A0A1I8HQB9_9PLAT
SHRQAWASQTQEFGRATAAVQWRIAELLLAKAKSLSRIRPAGRRQYPLPMATQIATPTDAACIRTLSMARTVAGCDQSKMKADWLPVGQAVRQAPGDCDWSPGLRATDAVTRTLMLDMWAPGLYSKPRCSRGVRDGREVDWDDGNCGGRSCWHWGGRMQRQLELPQTQATSPAELGGPGRQPQAPLVRQLGREAAATQPQADHVVDGLRLPGRPRHSRCLPAAAPPTPQASLYAPSVAAAGAAVVNVDVRPPAAGVQTACCNDIESAGQGGEPQPEAAQVHDALRQVEFRTKPQLHRTFNRNLLDRVFALTFDLISTDIVDAVADEIHPVQPVRAGALPGAASVEAAAPGGRRGCRRQLVADWLTDVLMVLLHPSRRGDGHRSDDCDEDCDAEEASEHQQLGAVAMGSCRQSMLACQEKRSGVVKEEMQAGLRNFFVAEELCAVHLLTILLIVTSATGIAASGGLRRRLPQALIIGAKKSGTRALLAFSALHPAVRAAGPEAHFFDRHFRRGLRWYRRRMPRSRPAQLTLEKTPAYLVDPKVPVRVRQMNPEMKLVLLVRDPVTRAMSDYAQAVDNAARRGRPPPPPFEQLAFVRRPDGNLTVNTAWSPVRIGRYAEHLSRWLDQFPRNQILVLSAERLV